MGNSGVVDVAVVGAGPAGLAAACVLRAANLDVVVLDAAGEGAHTSRAAVIHARTLEVLADLDVTPRLLAKGIRVPIFSIRDGKKELGRLDFSRLRTRYPFTLMLPQSDTEAVLLGRLEELGGTVRRNCEVVKIHQHAGSVTVRTREPDSTEDSIQAKFVIGADGMHSTVRTQAGIPFDGSQYEQSFVLADVQLVWPLADDEVQLFFSPSGLVVVAPLPSGHHRVVATTQEAPLEPSLEYLQELLTERGPRGTRVTEVAWSSRFRVHHRLARSYRRGRVFIAGDAAHVHSPAGGQGMNTGIQDAVDLGCSLRAVLSADAPESSLDDYERRRRPIAQDVVALTDRMTRAATLRNPAARSARNLAVAGALQLPSVRSALSKRIAELH